MLLLLLAVMANRRNKLIYGPAAVLSANLAIHVFRQYGLKEGFLYSLHHQFAQLLIFAGLFMFINNRANEKKAGNMTESAITLFITAFIMAEILFDLMGFAELNAFLMRL